LNVHGNLLTTQSNGPGEAAGTPRMIDCIEGTWWATQALEALHTWNALNQNAGGSDTLPAHLLRRIYQTTKFTCDKKLTAQLL